jgi:membrane-bound lytic murein transglycosylase D
MRFDTPLVIGRTKKLDFSRVTPEVFEQRRLAYHRDLQEEFFAAFSVSGTRMHTLRRGDSLWYLANEKYEVPIWLLRQYNPALDFGALPAGTAMVIPTLEARAHQGGSHTPTAPIAASLATRL